jgi:hypothetical protein
MTMGGAASNHTVKDGERRQPPLPLRQRHLALERAGLDKSRAAAVYRDVTKGHFRQIADRQSQSRARLVFRESTPCAPGPPAGLRQRQPRR